ncbi:MDR family MFS transporter [Microbispora sp. KK1-11]|uniref:MDR family MFS transporter n=1 Tax=Microbispora sp. KK1-11 TaxID=2053005 RepID=UPI001C8E31FE|nr:MDR family MFS transporter [Microbispora sp. KK1-11]
MSTTASGAPPAGQAAPALSAAHVRLAVAGVMAGMLLSALDQTVVSTALPRIVSDLGGMDMLSWVVTAYLVTSMVVTPLWGKISDLYGRRSTFMAAIGSFLVASALCGLAQDVGQLIAFRALQGLGGGGLFALALTVIGDVVPPRERGRYQGYFAGVFALASIGGPLLGGWLSDGPGWRWIFWVNVPVGLVSLAVVAAVLRLPVTRREHHVDYLGAALIVAGVTALLLYLDWAGEEYGWAAPGSLALLAGFAVAAALFVVVERRAAEPVIPLRLFGNPVFRVANVFGFLAGAAMFSGIVFLPVYLQVVSGMSPTAAGLAMLPAMFGIIIATAVSGNLITRTGRYKVFPVLGSVLLVLAMLPLSRLAVDTAYWWVAVLSFVFGAGTGLTMQPVLTAVQNAVEMRDLGAATGAANFFQRMGAAVGTAVLGAVFSSGLARHLADEAGGVRVAADDVQAVHRLAEPVRGHVLAAFAQALDDVFLVAVPVVVLALVVSLFLREAPPRQTTPPADGAQQAAGAEQPEQSHQPEQSQRPEQPRQPEQPRRPGQTPQQADGRERAGAEQGGRVNSSR